MSQPKRIENQPAFVLHHYPYRETSQIIEIITRDYGCVAMVAWCAPSKIGATWCVAGISALIDQLVWQNELKTLHAAEWQGGVPQLTGLPLMCGFI